MPKTSTKQILAALKKSGVDLGDDLEKVTGALEDIELSVEGNLGADQMILSKEEHRELKDDLTKLRRRAKTAETDLETLQKDVDAGDSTNARQLKLVKARNEELEPLVETLLERQKDAWKAGEARIPETLKGEFETAEKGKELTTDQVLANTKKYAEYVRVGLIESSGEPAPEGDDPPKTPTAPRVPQKQPKKLTQEQLGNMSAASKIEAGTRQWADWRWARNCSRRPVKVVVNVMACFPLVCSGRMLC